jgi:polyhydroxyalkanoate synthesis regulator phasin
MATTTDRIDALEDALNKMNAVTEQQANLRQLQQLRVLYTKQVASLLTRIELLEAIVADLQTKL